MTVEQARFLPYYFNLREFQKNQRLKCKEKKP